MSSIEYWTILKILFDIFDFLAPDTIDFIQKIQRIILSIKVVC